MFELFKTTSDDELINLMKEEWENLENADQFFNIDKSQEMLGNILPAEDEDAPIEEIQLNPDRKWPSMFRIMSVAAAILIMVSSGLYFWPEPVLNPKPNMSYTALSKDAPPGGNKAVLTLADGQTIILDSAENGIIARTSNFEVNKTKDGQLVFHAFERDNKNAPIADFNIISTPRGGEYQIILPDDSKVWLNAASSIKFPGVFKGNRREIKLEGEAYFEITKNSAMPFIVRSKGSEIEVLGTRFNVRAYNDENKIKTTLVEGSVKIIGGNSTSFLKPGDQAVIHGSDMRVINNVDIDAEIAWKNGIFQFKDAGIEDVMRQAALWYDLNVSFEGKISKKYFTGKVSRSVNASEFMNMLRYTGIKFEIDGKNIVVINK